MMGDKDLAAIREIVEYTERNYGDGKVGIQESLQDLVDKAPALLAEVDRLRAALQQAQAREGAMRTALEAWRQADSLEYETGQTTLTDSAWREAITKREQALAAGEGGAE